VGLLHGRLPSDEKEDVMRRFKLGEVQVLVSTTVIEVGVDVPNATVMLIEHAERFGLAQLHQLRGRIGRGRGKSTCLLVAAGSRSEVAEERLRTMTETTDGFKIAEIDLKLRGPGDFFGTRQAGIPTFRIANLVRDRLHRATGLAPGVGRLRSLPAAGVAATLWLGPSWVRKRANQKLEIRN
jgi:ATP-dependent DNA helicase RecG